MKDSTTLKGVINKFDSATTALKEAALIARNTATTNEGRQCAEQAIKKANRAQAIINLIQRKEQIKELGDRKKYFY